MDVLSLDLDRFTPYGVPGVRGRPARAAGAVVAWLARLLDLRPAGPGGPAGPVEGAAADSRRALLLGYTAAEILLGLGLLVAVTARGELWPTIASDALAGTVLAGPTGGVLLWTMFGLMGSVRSFSSSTGSGHFTFHMPFVGAAAVLGGPAAGAWVGFLSTIDRRELETQPWYGVLANHAAMAISAVTGAIVFQLANAALLDLTGDPRLALAAAILVAGLTLVLVGDVLAGMTIKIRDELSWAGLVGIFIDEFRRETMLEIALVWVLVIASSTVGWWAPLVVGIAVIWYASRERANEGPDGLSGLPRKAEFLRRVDGRIGWIRRGILPGGAMLFLDLNGFHLVNNLHGHEVGDVVLKVISERMRAVITRREDLVSRLMGDEFGVFLPGVTSTEVAVRKAEQLLDAIARPVATPVGPITVGVAIGLVVVDGGGIVPPSAMTLLHRSEQAMYLAKRESGPQGGIHAWSDDDPPPFSTDWLEGQR